MPAGLELDAIVARYSLHHIPDLPRFAVSIARALRKAGRFLVADPHPLGCDTTGFVDEYMQMKSDGQVRLHPLEELRAILGAASLTFVGNSPTTIGFPRPWNERYGALLERARPDLVERYRISREGDCVRIELPVANALFAKL